VTGSRGGHLPSRAAVRRIGERSTQVPAGGLIFANLSTVESWRSSERRRKSGGGGDEHQRARAGRRLTARIEIDLVRKWGLSS
jgi:hypothetical protein